MNHRLDRSRFPIQKLTLKQKTEEWRKATVDSLIAREGGGFRGGLSGAQRKKVLYDLWNSKYDLNDIKYVIDPFKVGEGFPARPQNFNIIRPKIELLIGEEAKRPQNIRVVNTGPEGYSKVQEARKELLFNYVMGSVDPELAPQEGEPQTPEEIEDYMNHKYSDITEKTALYSLKYLKEKLNLNNEFLKGWRDALICGEEIYFIGIINGEPYVERVNPLTVTYDTDPDIEFIEDGEYVIRHMYMSPTSIYDRFNDMLSEEDLDKILETSNQDTATGKASDVNYQSVVYKENPLSEDGVGNVGNELDVWHVVWKSYKRIGFLSTTDEEGNPTELQVDETYKILDEDKERGDTISWDWAIEVWEGYRVGKDIYFGIDPIPNQMISVDNPNSTKLPYTGAVYNQANTSGVSLVELMKPLQYMYIIIWYRLEIALSRDKGKIINMDITQIPKSMNVDVSKWLHMLSSLGVNLFNPYEEGWDIPGREGGKAAAYNQMSQQDLTIGEVIVQYIQLMDKIEDMVGELSGVSKARQGQIHQSSLVGNVQQEIIQSSHITEPYFWVHNQVKKNVLNLMLNTAKTAWSENPDKVKLNYVLDDMTRICLEMSEDFLYSDQAIFITDSSEENRKLEQIRGLYQAALQSGTPLSDIVSILTYDSITEIKNKLLDLEKQRMETIGEQQQAERESAMEAMEYEREIREEEIRIKEEDSIRKANTAVEVAMIQSDSRAEVANASDGGEETDYSSEREKLSIMREKMQKDATIRKQQLDETIRTNKKKEELKEKEISIRKKTASSSKK